MFVYEKDGKLNIMFQSTQIPTTGTPDIQLQKVDGAVSILVSGSAVGAAGATGPTANP